MQWEGKGGRKQWMFQLCDPTDCSPPGFSVHELLQARILEWVAIPSPGDLPHPGIKPGSSALQPDALLSELPGKVFLQAVDPLCMKTADPKNTDPRLVETRRLILETPP